MWNWCEIKTLLLIKLFQYHCKAIFALQTFLQFTSNTFLSEDHPKAQKAPCGKTLIPPLPAFLQLKILRQDFPDNFAAEIFIAYWSLYRASQEKELTECCCNHGAKAQSPVAGIPCVWKLFFFGCYYQEQSSSKSFWWENLAPQHSSLVRIFSVTLFWDTHPV